MEMSVGNTYNGKSLETTASESIASKTSNFSKPATHCNKRRGGKRKDMVQKRCREVARTIYHRKTLWRSNNLK